MAGSEAIRRYWSEGADQAQREVRFGFTILSATGDTGIARWWASFERVPSGVQVELDGILAAEFGRSSRCRVFREWWHRRELGPGGPLRETGPRPIATTGASIQA